MSRPKTIRNCADVASDVWNIMKGRKMIMDDVLTVCSILAYNVAKKAGFSMGDVIATIDKKATAAIVEGGSES